MTNGVISKGLTFRSQMEDFERELLFSYMEMTGGHIKRAAMLAGSDYQSFYYRLKKHGMTRRQQVYNYMELLNLNPKHLGLNEEAGEELWVASIA